jgi:ribosomal protein S6--L-glutamate ligase
MNIAILSNQSDKYKSNKLIIEAGKKRNHNVFVLNPKNLVMYLSDKEGQSRIYTNENGILERLPKIECIIPRLTDVSKNVSIVEFFSSMGVYSTQNSESLIICQSKWKTLLRANEFGIKVPKTYFSNFNSENLDAFIESLKLPVVLKLEKGSQGVGVMLFSEKQALKTTAETFSKQGTPFILQEMINTKGKQHDFRTIVIGNDCVASMKKTVHRNNEFRTNLARKGTAENYKLSEEERLFCLKVAQSISGGGDTFGIDWMVQDGEPVLLEVNSNYGTQIIDVVKYNFFDDLFFHIEMAVADLNEEKKKKSLEIKENSFLYEEIQNLKNELTKKENLLNDIFDNEKMKNLFRSLKGKLSGYTDSEKKEKKIKIIKPKQIIEMMLDMIEIEK